MVFAYHLTVFFLLSGYTLKDNLSWTVVKKRFRSLMLPYGITCLAITLLDVVNLLIRGERAIAVLGNKVLYDLARSLVASGSVTRIMGFEMGGRIGAIWFLPGLFLAATGVQLLLRWVKNKPLQYLLAITAAVMAVISAEYIWFPFSIQSAMMAVPVVLLGYDMKRLDLMEKLNWKHMIICLAIYLFAMAKNISKVYYVSCILHHPLVGPVCALASSFCVLYLSRRLEMCRYLVWVGRNSIYFLCIHVIEMETLGGLFKWLLTGLGLPYEPLPRFILKMIFITLASAVLVKLTQRRKNLAKK